MENSESPSRCSIRCEQCQRKMTPRSISKCAARCPCGNGTWNLSVEYFDRVPSTARTILLNAAGFLALFGAGTGIFGKATSIRKVNSLNFHDVPAHEMDALCSTPSQFKKKLVEFLERKRQETFQQHKEEMHERGAMHCKTCEGFFVPSASKPWTMLKFCSKTCCALSYGHTDYSRVEHEVNRATSQHKPELEQVHVDLQLISARCSSCGHRWELPRMYGGLVRKCPQCQHKVMIPSR